MAIHCSDIETLVHTYLDGELAEDDVCEFENHAAECAVCGERLRLEVEFRSDLRRKLAAPRAPDTLRARLGSALDEVDRAEALAQRDSRLGWILPGVATFAAAAALVLFFTVGDRTNSANTAGEPIQHDAVRAHLRRAPLEVTGAANRVSPWIKKHFQPRIEPPRFSGPDVALRGARLGHLQGRDSAQLFYQVERNGRRHDVNVHVIDGADLDFNANATWDVGGRKLGIDEKLGYSIVTYQDEHGIGWVFTSDMSKSDLANLVMSSDLLLRVDERLRNRK